jgi:hypothetical protein
MSAAVIGVQNCRNAEPFRRRPSHHRSGSTAPHAQAPAQRGLRVRTAFGGIATLEAVEALHAAARGRRPRGEFLMEAHALSLGAALPSGATASTWQVVVGARLGRRPPPEFHLLAFEALEGANCAVVSRDVRPAGRAVAEGLRRLGIQEERPRALNALATHLAQAHAGGLFSLEHAHDQRIAAGVLEDRGDHPGSRLPYSVTALHSHIVARRHR